MTKTEVYSENLDSHIGTIDSYSEEFLEKINSITDEVKECIGTSSGGVYGSLGTKLLSVWNDKCDSFSNYYSLYEMYVGILSSVSQNNKEFIVETEVEYGGEQNE